MDTPEIARLEHATLNDKAYSSLKAALISGGFQPGQALVIRTLAAQFGISPTPVREALQRLVAERLLEVLPSRSVVVPDLSAEKFEQLTQIRCALEGLAAERACGRLAPSDLALLARYVEESEAAAAARDVNAYLALNESFHFLIYQRAGSLYLLEMIQDLWCRVGPFLRQLFNDPDYGPHATDHHRRMLAALEQDSRKEARRHLMADIKAAAQSIIPRLG